MASDDPEELLEPKINRPPGEVGREIYRLLESHDALRVERREDGYDVRVTPIED